MAKFDVGGSGEARKLRGGSSDVAAATPRLPQTIRRTSNVSRVRNKSEKRPQREIEPHDEESDNSVAICAIMKQEQLPDIWEWLMYHRCLLYTYFTLRIFKPPL